jgi:hypothetical protein
VIFKSKPYCSQSIFNQVQGLIRSGGSLNYFASQLLSQCSNKPADVHVIDFDCVPNEGLPWVKTYEVCSGQAVSDSSAVVKTPGFPALQSNKDCSLTINTGTPNNKVLRVFAISTELQTLLPNTE